VERRDADLAVALLALEALPVDQVGVEAEAVPATGEGQRHLDLTVRFGEAFLFVLDEEAEVDAVQLLAQDAETQADREAAAAVRRREIVVADAERDAVEDRSLDDRGEGALLRLVAVEAAEGERAHALVADARREGAGEERAVLGDRLGVALFFR